MILTLTIVHVIVSILLIITVLLQFGKGAEAGFFSNTDSQGVFAGPGQSNLLSKTTTFLAIVFLVLAVVLANLRGQTRDTSVFDSEEVVTNPLGDQAVPADSVINKEDSSQVGTTPEANAVEGKASADTPAKAPKTETPVETE